MSFGADPTLPNCDGRDAIALASGRGEVELLRALLFSNCRGMLSRSPPVPKRSPLIEAVIHRQAQCIPLLLEYGIDINHCSHYDNGGSALMLAVQLEDEASVTALLQHSPSLTIHDSMFNSAMVYACLGSLTILDRLIAYDAKAFRVPTMNNINVIESALRYVTTQSKGNQRSAYLIDNLITSVPMMVSIGVPITRQFLDELCGMLSSSPKLSRPFSAFALSDIESARLYNKSFDAMPCDVQFILSDDQTAWGHLTILRTMSEYFRDIDGLIDSPFVVHLEDYSLDDFLVVKHFVYTNILLYRRDYSNIVNIAKRLKITRLSHLYESDDVALSLGVVPHLSSVLSPPKFDNFNNNACAPSPVTSVVDKDPFQSIKLNSTHRERQMLLRKQAMMEGPHDIVLRCEGSELSVSSFFINEGKLAAMIHFHRTLKQPTMGQPLLIDIVDMTFPQLKDVVSFLYLGRILSIDTQSYHLNDVSLDHVLALYDVSVYYLIDDLQLYCELLLPRLVGKNVTSAYQVFQRAIALHKEQLAIDTIHKCLLEMHRYRGPPSILENKHMVEEMLRFLINPNEQ